MLHHGPGGAGDDGVFLAVLQQHAHDGGFGNEGVQLLPEQFVLRQFCHAAVKAGAVVVIHSQQTVIGPARQV